MIENRFGSPAIRAAIALWWIGCAGIIAYSAYAIQSIPLS